MELIYWIVSALALFSCSDAISESEFCRPQPTLIPIDHPNYDYFPYIVKLHRCGGVCDYTPPTIKKCVAVVSKNVTITLHDFRTSKIKRIQLVNHTKCGCQCVIKPSDCTEAQVYNKDSCQCRCKYSNTPPQPCPHGFGWSISDCSCVCQKPPEVCPVGKTWDRRACGCVCDRRVISQCKRLGMTIDDQCECKPIEVGAHTGEKREENPKFSKFTLLLMVGEFVVLCVIFDAILSRWKAGFTYNIIKKLKCKGRSKDVNTPGENLGKDNTTDTSSYSTRDSSMEQV